MDVPLVVTDFDRLHLYLNWDGWMKDLAWERRMRHRPSTESVFVDPMPTTWLYIYIARHAKDAGVVWQRSFDHIVLHQFVTLAAPLMIGVARLRC